MRITRLVSVLSALTLLASTGPPAEAKTVCRPSIQATAVIDVEHQAAVFEMQDKNQMNAAVVVTTVATSKEVTAANVGARASPMNSNSYLANRDVEKIQTMRQSSDKALGGNPIVQAIDNSSNEYRCRLYADDHRAQGTFNR